jgi:hypothetical protein
MTLEHIIHLSYVSLLLNEMSFSAKRKNLCFYVVKKTTLFELALENR